MSDEDPLEGGLAALSAYFVGGHTMHETLERVAHMALRALPGAKYAGMTLMEGGRPATSVFTDPSVPEIDQGQYDADSGPCLDAFRQDRMCRIDSTRHDTRWVEFSQACLRDGILSTLSFPLTVDDTTNGALNLYAPTENAFGPEDTRTGSLFAAQAAIVLANAAAYWTARGRAEHLELALQTRAPIEQAKGIIIATMRCSPDEAFEILVKQSRQQNRKLRDLAAEIVHHAWKRP